MGLRIHTQMENNNDINQNGLEDVPRIRTFQSDIAEAMTKKQGSVIKIAVAEHERKEKETTDTQNQKKNNGVYILLGSILLVATTGIGYFLYQKNKALETKAPIQKQKSMGIIQVDTAGELLLKDTSSTQKDFELVFTKKPLSIGQVGQIIFTQVDENKQKKLAPLSTILSDLSISTPEDFSYSLAQDQFAFGVYQSDTAEKFIVLKTTAFANTFAAALSWEKTMYQDLKDFFGIEKIEEDISFKDKIIKNEDTRIMKKADGIDVLSYTFFGPKKELMLITRKSEILGTLIERFTTRNIKQ